MVEYLQDRRYLASHEWVKLEGEEYLILSSRDLLAVIR